MKRARQETAANRLLRLCKKIIIGIPVTGGLGLLYFLVMHSDHGYLALKQNIAEENRLHEAVKAGQQRNQELEREVQRLKDDPQVIEKIAREELGLASPKDLVIKLQKPATPAPK